MIKTFCDICGNEMTNHPITIELRVATKLWSGGCHIKNTHICEICHRKIEKFLKETKDE